jgi:glycosyltransferase involved in cell wall biosynthesis
MRILIGVLEIAGLIPVYADGFRQLGHEVTTVVRQKIPWYEANYNFELHSQELTLDDAILIGYLLGSHDGFVYEWARAGLLPWAKDLELIKDIGKKSISIFQGSDVRYYPAYIDWYAIEKESLLKLPFPYESVSDSLRPLRKAEKYSDLILSLQNQSVLGIRPYMHSFLPMKLDDYPFKVPGRDVPIVVHSPSRKWIKGSEIIEQALEDLRREGVLFQSYIMHNISNKDVIRALVNADVVIDQLFFPLSGKLALEGMACGCAVASGDREEVEPFPPNRPIWHIDYRGVKEQLKELLTNKELRVKLAYAGRDYVEKYHNHIGVANRILHLLYSDDSLIYDYYPTFYFNQFH